MIHLNETHYIAEGLARVCYAHPDNENLCIKIGKPNVEVAHLYKEIKYFEKIKSKNTSNYAYPFYAMYHGEIETNLGVGFVYDLIKDETTGNISLTLRHYLEMENCPFTDAYFVKELERLKQQMITHKVHVGDLRARNICVKVLKDISIQLIVIDGLGHRDFFPLGDWFHYFAKKKVERRFVKNKLHSLDAQRELIKQMRAAGETII